MTRLPPRPDLSWKSDGTPVADQVGDIYFSRDDGLEETRIVFLQACGLPERWADRDHFTVAELGFGTGLNFLALWQIWNRHTSNKGWLHFVSFEGFPLDKEDAARALEAWPELSELTAKLLDKWPVRAQGVQQVSWPEDRLSLTLHTGEIADTLPQSRFKADAWFLDGFSPAKNSEMWDDKLWPFVAARSAPQARLGTFTVAGTVRRGLESAGFRVERLPGHGRKRQRLEAVFRDDPEVFSPGLKPSRIAIIGCGIGGLALATQARHLGAEVTMFDAASGPLEGTSGNPLALVMPRLDATDTPEARLLIDAYLSALAFYKDIPGATPINVHHRPKDEAESVRFSKLLSDPPLGLDHLEATRNGVLHKGALVIRPADLFPALVSNLEVSWDVRADIDLDARSVNGEIFDAIILATGWHMAEALPWLRLKGRAGQVEHYQSQVDAPASALASGHYALALGPYRVWGATYQDHDLGVPAPSIEGREHNAEGLASLAPYWEVEARKSDIVSRAGVRATTPDRLPIIGALPDYEAALEVFSSMRTGRAVKAEMPTKAGIYVAGGFGSRGYTFAPFAAAILMSEVFGTPCPTSHAALEKVAPGRQILRDLKRRLI